MNFIRHTYVDVDDGSVSAWVWSLLPHEDDHGNLAQH